MSDRMSLRLLGLKSKTAKICLILILLVFLTSTSSALINPSAVYCNTLGYEYVIEKTESGERGYCKLPNGQKVGAWDFLEGKVAKEYSYCRIKGYELKVVSDKCEKFLTDKCAVCVLPNGTEVEVTELMGLSFEESKCGDGVCGFPENHQTCPSDCPQAGWDAYCEPLKDSICDPDCGEKDPDCVVEKEVSAGEGNGNETGENQGTGEIQNGTEKTPFGNQTAENESGQTVTPKETQKQNQIPSTGKSPEQKTPGFEWLYALGGLAIASVMRRFRP